MNDEDKAIDLLRSKGYAVKEPPPEPEPNKCYVCGGTEEELNCYLTDIKIVIADGEEGYSYIDSFLCDDHLMTVTKGLVATGMSIHAHGGICFLEPEDCPGYHGKECPTPQSQFED